MNLHSRGSALPGAALMVIASVMCAPGQECRLTPLSPAQPPLKVVEGERATDSETFQTTLTAISPQKEVYVFDTASRIRRITAGGRMETVAGNGIRAEQVTPGDARAAGLPALGQLVFSRDGVLHFSASGQIYRLRDGQIERVAGTGRPGFNGEEGDPLEVNLGSVVNFAFSFANELLIVDGYNRIRRLEAGGLRSIAGSTRIAATSGLTGDGGQATQAALSNPRQVVPFTDGSFWIRDLGGRHIRLVGADGVIRTVNQSFDTAVSLLQFPDGSPGASSSNRVYPVKSNGVVETGSNPFAPFTGTPRAIDGDGALYFEGSTRPDQRAPLLRLSGRRQELLAGAPVPPIVEGQAPPFGVWNPRTGSLVYSANLGAYSAIVEARPGQNPRVIVGGGSVISDAGGKQAADLTIYGIVSMALDNEGRILIGDSYRRRILVVETSGQVAVLKDNRGDEIIYTPMGSLASLQKIAADGAGNIYWFHSGATPTGGVFESQVAVWSRDTQAVTTFPVRGLYHLAQLPGGGVAAIAGNGSNYRRIYQLSPAGAGATLAGTGMLAYGSYTIWKGTPYFTAATRLFRGDFGRLEMLDLAALDTGAAFSPDYVLATPEHLLVHLSNGGFYRLEDPAACRWIEQPRLSIEGVVNAANGQNPGVFSPRQLIRVHGTGLGPAGGQGYVLDGSLRATGQAAPFPALTLGNFSGTIEFNTLSGTVLPVLYSDDTQAIYQGVATVPTSGSYLLYYSWQGLQLIHPDPLRMLDATPALFAQATLEDGQLARAEHEDGSLNAPANPAPPGAAVRLIATGLGAMTDNLATGQFCGTTPVAVTGRVTVTIGGEEAAVAFAGCRPGTIAGTYQIQVTIPESLAPGLHEVSVRVGEAHSPAQPRMLLAVGAGR